MNPWNSCLAKLTLELTMNEAAAAKKNIAIWLVLLALGAALVNLPIREVRLPGVAMAA